MEVAQLRGNAVNIYKIFPAWISVKYGWVWISVGYVEL